MNVADNVKCAVCETLLEGPVLNLGNHPLCDDLIPLNSDFCCEEFPIAVQLCTNCLTANQLHHVDKTLLFPKTYHYRARFTKDVLDGMENLAQEVITKVDAKALDSYVLDVGCNDGSLLNCFHDLGLKTLGVDVDIENLLRLPPCSTREKLIFAPPCQ